MPNIIQEEQDKGARFGLPKSVPDRPRRPPMSTGPTSIHTQPSLSYSLLHFCHITLQLLNRAIDPLQALQVATQNLRDLAHRIFIQPVRTSRRAIFGISLGTWDSREGVYAFDHLG